MKLFHEITPSLSPDTPGAHRITLYVQQSGGATSLLMEGSAGEIGIYLKNLAKLADRYVSLIEAQCSALTEALNDWAE